MRWFLVCLCLLPTVGWADLLDILPLKRIERNMLYPYTKSRMQDGAAALAGLSEQELTSGDVTLKLWTARPKRQGGPVILYFHGNAGTLAHRLARFKAIKAQGFGLVAPAYRGGSGTRGVPSEERLISDAEAVFLEIPTLLPGAEAEDVVLYGESLGSAVAIALASQLDAGQMPAGLVLEAPFTSVPEMAQSVTDMPPNVIAKISDRWESLERIKQLSLPLLVLHGSADEVTPYKMGRAIHDAAPSKDKRFIGVPGASHVGTWTTRTQPQIWRFVRRQTSR